MRNLFLICPVFFLIFFISCGDIQKKEEKKAETAVNNDDIESQENSKSDTKKILFFGTSLTAGKGLDPDEAYPAVIQEKIDSLELPYEVINAGLSGETTAGGRNRISWVLNQDIDVFVLELGANDGLRGTPVEETRKNLQAIIDTVQQKDPDIKIILAGMQMPPNLGEQYTSKFKNLFPELAEKNDVHLIPFLLKDVGGVPELNQQDRIHPTAEGQKILAENVWEVLKPVLEEE